MPDPDEMLRASEAIEIIRQLACDMEECSQTVVEVEDITLALSVLHDELHQARQRELLQQIGTACAALLSPLPDGWRGSYAREAWCDALLTLCDQLTE